jgi:ribulose-phosphate 3-epimerase
MINQKQILPSILSANFAHLEADIKRCEKSGARMLHLDVMDGAFVPNISFGPGIVHSIRRMTDLVLDTHLMIENPDKYLEVFQQAGTQYLTVHVEACRHLHRTITKIRELGMKPGVSVNPATPLTAIDSILEFVDLVLIMSVNPGFGGQRYIPTSTNKIMELKKIITSRNLPCVIEVDGGIDAETLPLVDKAGATFFVAGNAVFKNDAIETNYKQLFQLIEN